VGEVSRLVLDCSTGVAAAAKNGAQQTAGSSAAIVTARSRSPARRPSKTASRVTGIDLDVITDAATAIAGLG